MSDLARAAVPLPATISGWERKTKTHRTLNDQVEELHRSIYDSNERYRALLEAIYDEQAIEGSLSADHIMAAQILRTAAEKRNSAVAKEKLATIGKCLNIVLRRYGQGRKERRYMVGGEIVPPDSNAFHATRLNGDNGE